MKIRIKDNAIRLRLQQREVQQLRHSGQVTGRTTFAERLYFDYQLLTSAQVEMPTAQLKGATLTIILPTAQAQAWADSNQVGIEHLQPNGTPEGLRLLIEKDFKCLTDRPHEDESDAYPHPAPQSTTC